MCVNEELNMTGEKPAAAETGGADVATTVVASPLESICENTVSVDVKPKQQPVGFSPVIRSGEWSDVGDRDNMEDTHGCISDLALKYGHHPSAVGRSVSFYGLESICESTAVQDVKPKQAVDFSPIIRSGEWSDIGDRTYMEDAHICIPDLALKYGYPSADGHPISFYGVFDGHEGKHAAHFVRDNLPRIVVEDSEFPMNLEKVIERSYLETDAKLEQECALHSSLHSGTTALTAMICGETLLVANAGDCRAVLSRSGCAIDMSKDHKPSCTSEIRRIEALAGNVSIAYGYLDGELGVTRALGDWHLERMKFAGIPGGPLIAKPELKMERLTKEDEFLIIGSDGIWDLFTSQGAVQFVRRRLQEHNNVRVCCKELIEEAKRRGRLQRTDNMTAVVICFQSDPPASLSVGRRRPGPLERVPPRSLSSSALLSLKTLLDDQ